jgi:hypothetical protein
VNIAIIFGLIIAKTVTIESGYNQLLMYLLIVVCGLALLFLKKRLIHNGKFNAGSRFNNLL